MIGVVVILGHGAINISKSLVQVRTLLQAVQVLVLTKEKEQKEMLMVVMMVTGLVVVVPVVLVVRVKDGEAVMI